MNHSGAFWKVKNQYSDELKELWAKGYTGEGMWSRGRTLLSGEYVSAGLAPDEVLPEHLCGGTFRSNGKRKRAAKPRLSWKEQKERRIKKKFGVDGKTLGADDVVKSELEQGKKAKGKPRVAKSNRGRELRAAAALARFEMKPKEEDIQDENDISTDSGSETEGEDHIKTEPGEAHDIDGSTLHDRKGRTMVKVCDDEEKDDVNVKNEMEELFQLQNVPEKEDEPEFHPEFIGSSPQTDPQDKDHYERRRLLMMDFKSDAEPSRSPPKKQSKRSKKDSQTEATSSFDVDLSQPSEYSKRRPAPAKRKLVPKAAARPEVVDGSETESDLDNSKKRRKPTGSFVSSKPKSKEVAEELAKKHMQEFFGAAAKRSLGKEDGPSKTLKPRKETPEVAFNPPFDIQSRPAAKVESPTPIPDDFPTSSDCPVCTTPNDLNAATCVVCNTVLDEAQVEGTWKCQRKECKESKFVNAGDYGRCMVCHQSRE